MAVASANICYYCNLLLSAASRATRRRATGRTTSTSASVMRSDMAMRAATSVASLWVCQCVLATCRCHDSYECVCASALIRCGPARRAASARRRHAGAGAVSWVRAGFWPVLAGGTQGGVGSGRGGGQGAAGRRPFKALLSFEAALLIAHARMLTARPYAAR